MPENTPDVSFSTEELLTFDQRNLTEAEHLAQVALLRQRYQGAAKADAASPKKLKGRKPSANPASAGVKKLLSGKLGL